MDKVTRQCPQTTTFLKRKESRSGIEPRSFRLQPNALPLDQTGSQSRQTTETGDGLKSDGLRQGVADVLGGGGGGR